MHPAAIKFRFGKGNESLSDEWERGQNGARGHNGSNRGQNGYNSNVNSENISENYDPNRTNSNLGHLPAHMRDADVRMHGPEPRKPGFRPPQKKQKMPTGNVLTDVLMLVAETHMKSFPTEIDYLTVVEEKAAEGVQRSVRELGINFVKFHLFF